jgi:hypothetical protein
MTEYDRDQLVAILLALIIAGIVMVVVISIIN